MRRRVLRVWFERGRLEDTYGVVDLRELGLDHPDRVEYRASSWIYLRRALKSEHVGVEHAFLDYGCGKGRVVRQAAQLPFGRVIGIDIASPLLDIARRNLENTRTRLRCSDIQLVCADVNDFEVPDEVTHAYLYNPFVDETFEAALSGLLRSLDRRPRRLLLIYVAPVMADAVLATGRFEPVRSDTVGRGRRRLPMHIYVSRAPRPAER